MIARSLRLRNPREFQRVRKRGRSWTTPYLVLVLDPNQLEHNRYGFAVGRRVGKAARRNRVKRWMRESIRKRHPDLRQGFDIVLIARGKVAESETEYSMIDESVGILVEKSGLVPPEADSVESAEHQDVRRSN
jgi:ribonuclease P protein component